MLAQELISDNGISQVALAFFTALFGFLALLFKKVTDGNKKSEETKEAVNHASEAASLAAQSAEKAVANTKNVSNGFAGTVLEELRQVRGDIQELSTSVNRHLEWHLDKEKKND